MKLNIRVSPRTVNKYLPRRRPRGDLRWSTFLRLHAQGIIACDFFLAITATFRQLYVFEVIEHRSRRLVHCNVTAHPTAVWTLQQLRETVGFEGRYEYLFHDRDSIFANHLDESIAKLEVKVLESPPRSPTANALCERVIGTFRRECLDWLIPCLHLAVDSEILGSALQFRASAHGVRSGCPRSADRQFQPSQILIRVIAAQNRIPSSAVQSWVGCITNIFLRPHERDLVFADHRDGEGAGAGEMMAFALL